MTSETRYQEGEDLDDLLATLEHEHAGQVDVVSVSYPRSGGVMGFFARERVGVEYRVAPPSADDPLRALIDAADQAESSARPLDSPAGTNAEFARMLLEMAAEKSAQTRRRPLPPAASNTFAPLHVLPAPAPAAQPTARPTAVVPAQPAPDIEASRVVEISASPAAKSEATPTPRKAVAHRTPARKTPARRSSTQQRGLASAGVPAPKLVVEGSDPIRAVAEFVRLLPAPPAPPAGVLAIVGPATDALAAAEAVRAELELPPTSIWLAGCRSDAVPAERTLLDRQGAKALPRRDGPLIVAVATTSARPRPWREATDAAGLVASLRAAAVWAVVNAAQKPADARAELASAGRRVDALIVTGCEATASPASVLELDLPVAMLGGRPATRGQWAATLLDALGVLDG